MSIIFDVANKLRKTKLTDSDLVYLTSFITGIDCLKEELSDFNKN